MTIWAPKMQGRVCTKIPYKGYEISIAMDDSCGVMEVYGRSSIAVFRGPDDVTPMFYTRGDQTMLDATAETIKLIFAKIDEMEKGQ